MIRDFLLANQKSTGDSSAPPSRKVSQDRPKLDKAHSTPAYEGVDGDMNNFGEKLKEMRNRKVSNRFLLLEEQQPPPASPTEASARTELQQVINATGGVLSL